MKIRRFLSIFLAVNCALWQVEWAALAATQQASSANLKCSCRGTMQCCCKHPKSAASDDSHSFCPLQRSSNHPRNGGYVLKAIGCSNLPIAATSGVQRDMFVPLQSTAFVVVSRSAAHTSQLSETSYRSVFLDPPFIPPEILLS